MKYRIISNLIVVAVFLITPIGTVVAAEGFLQSDATNESPDHNCRFWGMLTEGYMPTSIRSHLEELQDLSSVSNWHGWGIGFYTRTIRSRKRIPVIFRGGWRAFTDSRYDAAADVLVENIVNSGVAHVRNAGDSEVIGVPNPHPFYTKGVDCEFDMMFAHNGSIPVYILQGLLGDYWQVNRYDYCRNGDTLLPNHDTDLYRLYLMKWIDEGISDDVTDCLVAALNNLITYAGNRAYNFVLASSCDTLWALRYNETLWYRRESHPSGADSWVWEVASEPLGGIGWMQASNYHLYVFTPNNGTPAVYPIDYDEETIVLGGQKTGVTETNRSVLKSCKVYPNPAANTLNIDYEMADPQFVSADLYDIAGRFVANVYSGTAFKGVNCFSYDTHDLPSGVYFVHLESNGDRITERIIIRR